ncbi:hypothetical protein [Salmonella phage SD-13_S19]|nr:hypothetical protein [Salmonella phage SD-13_S19]
MPLYFIIKTGKTARRLHHPNRTTFVLDSYEIELGRPF